MRIVTAGTLFLAVAAFADGAPTQQPLTYRGRLLSSSGAPINAPQAFTLRLWTDATSTALGMRRCVTTTQTRTPDNQGNFFIQVDDPACTTALQQFSDVWAELEVSTVVLPRTKLGAVPYALESTRAKTATAANRHVISANGLSHSMNGVFCGLGPLAGSTGATQGRIPSPDGGVMGYRGAKVHCEEVCGSATAHMCNAQETIVSHTLGFSMPVARIAGGFIYEVGTTPTNDCEGYTTLATTVSGAIWDGSRFVSATSCGTGAPFLCCD